MRSKFKSFLILIPAVLVLSGCPRREPVPEVEVSRLEAELALARARSEIYEAKEAGADVSEPESILARAHDSFDAGNYARAKSEAEQAGALARRLRDEMLAGLRGEADAAAAIERAERLISRAADLGGDVSQPESLLEEAKLKFSEEDYPASIDLADQAAELAQSIIDSLTADIYTVGTWQRDRDCLWNIAARRDVYNDPWKWKRIYRANEDKITDPDLIYPGQRLIIPRD